MIEGMESCQFLPNPGKIEVAEFLDPATAISVPSTRSGSRQNGSNRGRKAVGSELWPGKSPRLTTAGQATGDGSKAFCHLRTWPTGAL